MGVLTHRLGHLCAILVAAEATMLVGIDRQALERARGPNDAYRPRRTAAFEFGIARYRPVAELHLPARYAGRRRAGTLARTSGCGEHDDGQGNDETQIHPSSSFVEAHD
jgi:hypothetical protein